MATGTMNRAMKGWLLRIGAPGTRPARGSRLDPQRLAELSHGSAHILATRCLALAESSCGLGIRLTFDANRDEGVAVSRREGMKKPEDVIGEFRRCHGVVLRVPGTPLLVALAGSNGELACRP